MIFSKGYANLIFPIPEYYPNEDSWTNLHFQYFPGTTIHVPVMAVKYRVHEGNSLKRTKDFGVVNEQLHARRMVYNEFVSKYNASLDTSSICTLEQLIKLEELRYAGKSLQILRLRGLSTKSKLRALFHSHASLFRLKDYMARWFIGW